MNGTRDNSAARRVDVGALSGALYGDSAEALADAIVLGFDWCDEDGCAIDQKQKAILVRAAFLASANLEASFARTIINELESSGVEAWGLSRELDFILARKAESDD